MEPITDRAREKARQDLGWMGPMFFVYVYRQHGWPNGELSGIMARAGIRARRIRKALAQDTKRHMAKDKPSYERAFLQMEAEEQRERYLPPEQWEALTRQRAQAGAKQPTIPMGRRASAAEQARIVAEQGVWGITQGGIAAAYDWMIAMNSLRAPAVRREIAYLQQFPPDSPERRRAEELRWDLPETWEALKQEALGKVGQAADSGLPADLALGSGRLYAQMAGDLGQWSGRLLTDKASGPLLAPDKMVSQAVAKGLLGAPWIQPALKEAARRYPGGNRILATVLSGLPIDVAKQIVAGESDPDRIFEKAKAELARRAVSGLVSAGGQDAAGEAPAGRQPEQ